MSVNLKADRLSFGQAAAEVNVHVATIWRWALHGVKGRKLRSFLLGGRRFILRNDLDAFLACDSDVGDINTLQPASSAHAAGEELDRRFASGNSNASRTSRQRKIAP